MAQFVLALPGDVALYTGTDVLAVDIPVFASATLSGAGSLSADSTRIDGAALKRTAALERQGHYRPTTWPAARPWKN